MKYIYLAIISVSFLACGETIADLSVDEYIVANKLITRELDKGVHIAVDIQGNDTKPNINSKVTVNYVGKLTNGVEFDSGSNKVFQLSGLIEGWKIGLKEIGEGASCTLIIPPGAGYGGSANGSIPANSVLVFDMDLIKVE